MNDPETVRRQFRQIRSLLQAGQQRIAVLRPVWGAYLAGETMKSLGNLINNLEKEIGLSPSPSEEKQEGMPRTG